MKKNGRQMMGKRFGVAMSACLMLLLFSGYSAMAESITFKDPKGDDKGPGEYIYPTDSVYKPGSFDLTGMKVKHSGKNVTFSVSTNSKLEDPWGMGVGFAVQMVFIFIDTTPDAGHTEGLAGLNVKFAADQAWDKVVILSPQKQAMVISEAKIKAAAVLADIVVPGRTKGSGKAISGKVSLGDLGGGDPAKWGYQVVMQSNEGFPIKTDLLTRRVNEFEGQHRWGGGNDADCDPHLMDILAGNGDGSADEIQAQYDQLAYECGEEGKSVKMTTLQMVRK